MSSKPILRVQKVKDKGRSTPESVGGHIARTRPCPAADAAKTHLNRVLIGRQADDLRDRIDATMRRAGLEPESRRADATVANDLMLSISPAWFRPDDPERYGHAETARIERFREVAVDWIRENFQGRCVKATLHLDEATPHIHAVVVPLLPAAPGPDGQTRWRLSGKEMFNPENLVRYQQSWEDALRPLGVGPRTPRSRTRHTTLREFYSVLEASRNESPAPPTVGAPPERGTFEGRATHGERVDAWRKTEAKRLRAERRPLEIAAARGRLYDAERRANGELRADLVEAHGIADRLRAQITDAQREAERSKAEVAALRGAPLNAVAEALGFAGTIGAKENAIDLVKRVGGLDYRESVAWLAQRFGTDSAAAAVRDNAAPQVEALATSPPVLTKAETVKRDLVAQQLDALAAPAYRVTVMTQRDDRKVAKNLGKAPKGQPERLWSRDEVIAMIPRLTAENMRGGNIFVTPLDDAAWHVLADDLSAERLAEMRREGYAPATVVETSPGNVQAVLKVPKDRVDKADTNTWFKDLNRARGDDQITGLIHPFRLVGFENRKERHRQPDGRFPFVRLREAVNRFCAHSVAVVAAYAARRTGESNEMGSDPPQGRKPR